MKRLTSKEELILTNNFLKAVSFKNDNLEYREFKWFSKKDKNREAPLSNRGGFGNWHHTEQKYTYLNFDKLVNKIKSESLLKRWKIHKKSLWTKITPHDFDDYAWKYTLRIMGLGFVALFAWIAWVVYKDPSINGIADFFNSFKGSRGSIIFVLAVIIIGTFLLANHAIKRTHLKWKNRLKRPKK